MIIKEVLKFEKVGLNDELKELQNGSIEWQGKFSGCEIEARVEYIQWKMNSKFSIHRQHYS